MQAYNLVRELSEADQNSDTIRPMPQVISSKISEIYLPGQNAVAVGMFDGVHRGHAFLIEKLRQEAQRINGRAVVFTFDRHPSELVAPEKAPPYITTIERKVELLYQAGADEVVVVRFDLEVAKLSPREFAENILLKRLNTRVVVVGPNFRFGSGRSGNIKDLKALGEELGFNVMIVPRLELHGSVVSSTRARSLISNGRVDEAAALLGQPFELPGRIIKGVGVGRQLGFPTANLATPERHIIPAEGVYAARVVIDGVSQSSAVSIGRRVSIINGDAIVEVYILDFEGDLYNRDIKIAFIEKIRDQRKFESKEALIEQIRLDTEIVRQRLQH